jgi:hypothetical protein
LSGARDGSEKNNTRQALNNRKEFAFDRFITQKLEELKPTS